MKRLLDLLDTKEMVVVCGSGGTGKTTVAAALGLQAAQQLDGRVLVLTVDPARRLADALGLGGSAGFGNTAVQVPLADSRGELWVAMLDTKAGWDELIRRHAPDPPTPLARARVCRSPLRPPRPPPTREGARRPSPRASSPRRPRRRPLRRRATPS